MAPESDADPVREVVGVVGDVRDDTLTRDPRPEIYVPIAQLPDAVNALDLPLLPVAWLIRTWVEPRQLSAAVQRELTETTGVPAAPIRSLDEVRAQSTGRNRFQTWLMVVFGSVASMLAGVGIYSVIAYSVEQRTREIGIRIACGATGAVIRKMVVSAGYA